MIVSQHWITRLISFLRSELKKYTKNATSLIVAQRIGTIINADKIIVLDKGECVGMGTHQRVDEDMQKFTKKSHIHNCQKEELENA